MDRKKIESRLIEWAQEFGFTLPDGSFPKSDLFAQLVATPHRAQLWDAILNKVESREKVQKIRKFIFATELKSDESTSKMQTYPSSVHSSDIRQKIDLWKKKEMLLKKIKEKKEEVADLQNNIYKKAQSIQSEVCKVAELEKQNAELKEKVLISNLLLEKYKNSMENYKKEIEKIKSFGIVNFLQDNLDDKEIKDKLKCIQNQIIEDLGKDDFSEESEQKIYAEVSKLVTDKNAEKKIFNLLLKNKKDNLNNYSMMNLSVLDKNLEASENISDESFRKTISEQLMLQITENSLQTCLNKALEKEEHAKFNEILSKIKKIIFNESTSNASLRDISYIKPNESGDSVEVLNEKMSKLTRALDVYGLKKRREFLKQEIEKLALENEKNEHWTTEMDKYKKETLQKSKELVCLKDELGRMVQMQKVTAESILRKYSELGSVINDINYEFKDKNIFKSLVSSNREIRKGMETKIDLIEDLSLDGFRKIQISPGKEVFEYESLPHCLNHYGGELRDFFSSMLLSPYEKPDSILTKLGARKAFLSHINEILEKEENDSKIKTFCNATAEGVSTELVEQNHTEVERILSKILMRKTFLTKEKDLVKQILRSWLEQPYRYMIPDSIKVNSMTLRQYENKVETLVEEVKYCSDTNATFSVLNSTENKTVNK